jgi:hypothetical protein
MNTPETTQELEEALRKARHKLWEARRERNYWKNSHAELQKILDELNSEPK